MTKKSWIIFTAVCVLLLGGLVYLSSQNRINIDLSGVNADEIQPARDQSGNIGDHVFGNPDSKVVLVEYGDYQCPGCATAYGTIKQATEEYKDDIAFVFRNFPLASIHPNARAAAAAAEAAGLQGKYWEMHDKLYPAQSNWSLLNASERTVVFEGYAQDLDLDMDKFKQDMTSQDVSQKINFDLALGQEYGVTSTPSIFLNGEPVEQEVWNSADELKAAIKSALESTGQLSDSQAEAKSKD